jgi:hypothetical protein
MIVCSRIPGISKVNYELNNNPHKSACEEPTNGISLSTTIKKKFSLL